MFADVTPGCPSFMAARTMQGAKVMQLEGSSSHPIPRTCNSENANLASPSFGCTVCKLP
jgi:hypothetical protein